ncbi:hypothetical protein E6O75_ATG00277 [Venturia nashicola]|uniref:Uncharacterized protein n=1 Tax=Venturia nashicola TaxID=86259 RepID=A0A4Z1PVQ9_9PEZI|nr:hypothetical protein E6O75_ATG00277 [Venturia nashicola]
METRAVHTVAGFAKPRPGANALVILSPRYDSWMGRRPGLLRSLERPELLRTNLCSRPEPALAIYAAQAFRFMPSLALALALPSPSPSPPFPTGSVMDGASTRAEPYGAREDQRVPVLKLLHSVRNAYAFASQVVVLTTTLSPSGQVDSHRTEQMTYRILQDDPPPSSHEGLESLNTFSAPPIIRQALVVFAICRYPIVTRMRRNNVSTMSYYWRDVPVKPLHM